MTAVTFAKLPTGEITVVLSITETRRSVTVGTRRPEKFAATTKARFKVIRMFADSLAFQTGCVCEDGTGREDDTEPTWYDPWVCKGNNWLSFDEYYKDWEWEEKKEKKGSKIIIAGATDATGATGAARIGFGQ